VIKSTWYWYRDRHVDQWNRTEDAETIPQTCWHLIFDKVAKNIQWKRESISNKWCWSYWLSVCRRMKIDPYLLPCTKLNSKRIKDLNIKPNIQYNRRENGKEPWTHCHTGRVPKQNSNG
jgi:hypothetical protein